MRRRILLVDDEPDTLESLATLLERESRSWEVLKALSPKEALERLEGVDMVVADQRMPGMSGIELLERVRHVNPSATRILITAHGDLEVALAAIERADVHYYLRKPSESCELAMIAKRVLTTPVAPRVR